MRLSHRFASLGVAVVALATSPSAQQQMIVTSGGPGGAGITNITSGPGGAAAKPLESGTGLLFGQTIDGLSQRPISGVLVTLNVAGAIPVRVLTDSDGHYTFRDIPKGGYSIEATKPGYSDGAYGRLRPEGPTQQLQLTDGQRLTDVQLPMWKLAALSGTVLNESGEPIVGASVRVLQRTIVGGKRQWTGVESKTTDDRGMYRVGGLVPGDYIVALPMTPPSAIDSLLAGLGLPDLPVGGGGGGAAVFSATITSDGGGGGPIRISSSFGGGGLGPAGMTEDGHELWYQTTFFPTAQSSARAEVLRLKSGEDRGGLDFAVKAARTVNVSGTLLGTDGPIVQTGVTLVPAEAGDVVTPVETLNASTDGNGHFQFSRVPPGQYSLRAIKSPRTVIGGPADTQTFQVGGNMMVVRQVVRTSGDAVPPLPTDPTLWIDTPVAVGASDVSDLALTLRPGVRVSGRIEFSGSATRPTPDQYPSIGISLVQADGRPSAAPGRGRVEPSGLFTTVGMPAGKYVLRVNAPNGWTVRSAAVGGRDISDSAVELHDGDIENVTVTFTDQKTGISGQITNAAGNADGKATVLIFPTDATLWTDSGPSPRRLKNIRAGSDGSYSASLPAGDYNVVAVSDTGAFEWNDPQFLAAMAPTATHVSIAEGSKQLLPLHTTSPVTPSGGGR